MDAGEAAFVEFARRIEPGLRVALVAAHGVDRGLEAANDALLHGWRHWDRVGGMENPGGYLYRVGERRARRRRLSPFVPRESPVDGSRWVEPRLSRALEGLSERQRQVVVLAASYEFTHREIADLLGISPSSVQTHYERGMAHLRDALRVDHG